MITVVSSRPALNSPALARVGKASASPSGACLFWEGIGRFDAEHVVGVHANGLTAFPSGDGADPSRLSPREQARLARLQQRTQDGLGYAMIQSTRPQTLAYGLADSPVGQLAWIVEKFQEWTDPAADLLEQAVDLDQMLANVTLYWLTNAGGSSAQIYYEGRSSWGASAGPSGGGLPTWRGRSAAWRPKPSVSGCSGWR